MSEDINPWEDSAPPSGARLSLSGRTGQGYEAGLINISGTVEEVAAFLKLDTESDAWKASPFATIVKTWNAGHVWAQADYKSKSSGKANAPKVESNRPEGATKSPNWMIPLRTSCPHGERVYWTKFAEDGTQKFAWKCPDPRGCAYPESFEFHDDPVKEKK